MSSERRATSLMRRLTSESLSLEGGDDLVLLEVLEVVVVQAVRTRLGAGATPVVVAMETQLQVLGKRQRPRLGSNRLHRRHLTWQWLHCTYVYM